MTFHNKAANLNGSAWSHTSPTQQSTSDFVGAGGIDQGIAGGHIVYGGNWRFLVFRRGRIEVTFNNKAANFNGSAWSHTSPTPQSTSDCIGADRIELGNAGQHIVLAIAS